MSRLALWMSVLLLAGCAAIPHPIPKPDDPSYAPIYPDEPEVNLVPTGSLYQQGHAENLYSDVKGLRVGDIITVRLQESTSAKKNANSQLDKDKDFSLSPFKLGGETVSALGYNELSASLTQASGFKGKSTTDQSNSLNGNITVTVTRVLTNGNLLIRGEKWMMLNNGDEYIRLTGVIRPEDISSDNTIASNRVADARIYYGGTGDFANTQKQGWLSRFFNGPWWPF